MRLVSTALLALTIAACGGSAAPARDDAEPDAPQAAGGSVSRSTFDGDWPLTVESGELHCFRGDGGRLKVVMEAPDGGVYALNGTARAESGWIDGYDILEADAIPADLSDLIERGLTLCE